MQSLKKGVPRKPNDVLYMRYGVPDYANDKCNTH
jgi:hypothetical protein